MSWWREEKRTTKSDRCHLIRNWGFPRHIYINEYKNSKFSSSWTFHYSREALKAFPSSTCHSAHVRHGSGCASDHHRWTDVKTHEVENNSEFPCGKCTLSQLSCHFKSQSKNKLENSHSHAGLLQIGVKFDSRSPSRGEKGATGRGQAYASVITFREPAWCCK